jgi:ribosomal protein L7/L12
MSNLKVTIAGFRNGAQKVSANHVLREHSSLGLADAKSIVDRVLSGESVSITDLPEADALSLVAKMDALGFNANLERW